MSQGKPKTYSKASLFLVYIAFFGIVAANGSSFKTIRISKTPGKQATALFDEIRKNYTVLEDGSVIQVRRLVNADTSPSNTKPESPKKNEHQDWRWVNDEASLKQHGLTYIATTVVSVVKDYEYAIQHLFMNSYTETTIPNYILVIPWDKTRVTDSWVEGLAKPCGQRDYPLGHGVSKQKDAFEMVPTKLLDSALFVESLKNGQTFQSLFATEIKCQECRGTGRIRPKSWIDKRKSDTMPCQKCAATGKLTTQLPCFVRW